MSAEETLSSVFEEGSMSSSATESDSSMDVLSKTGPVAIDSAETPSYVPERASTGSGEAHPRTSIAPASLGAIVGAVGTTGRGGGDVSEDQSVVRHTQSVVGDVGIVVPVDPSAVGSGSAVGDDRSVVRHTESVVPVDQSIVATHEGPDAMEIDNPGMGT